MVYKWYGQPLGFYQILTTKKKTKYRPNIDHTALYWPNIDRKSSLKSAHLHHKKKRISTKYRPHSTLSTKYRPQKFLEKRTFTIFTFKSWDIHILGKWGLSWNMRDKWGLFQLRTFRKALYMDHTALCRPYIQTIIETSIKVYVLNLKML